MFNNACQEFKVSELLEIFQIDIPQSTIFLSIEESVESNCLPHSSSEKETSTYISWKTDTTPKCPYNPRIKEIIHLSIYEPMM